MTLQFKRFLCVEIVDEIFVKYFGFRKITDLRIDFDIGLTTHPEPNAANLTIFNLSDRSRDVIVNKGFAIRIIAGYDPAVAIPQVIFSGSIVNAANRKERTGWITEISALDGHNEIKKAHFDKTFAAGTPIQIIIAAICGVIGLPFELGYIARNDTIIVGTTYDGSCFNVLNRLCAQLNLKWSIQQGVLQISDKDAPVTSAMTQCVLLSPDTGLIGSPVVSMEESPEKNKPIGSISAVSLLNPLLLPDRPVKIMPTNPATFAGINLVKMKKKSGFNVTANGLYRIETARFTGSNKSGVFHSEITCPIWAAA